MLVSRSLCIYAGDLYIIYIYIFVVRGEKRPGLRARRAGKRRQKKRTGVPAAYLSRYIPEGRASFNDDDDDGLGPGR